MTLPPVFRHLGNSAVEETQVGIFLWQQSVVSDEEYENPVFFSIYFNIILLCISLCPESVPPPPISPTKVLDTFPVCAMRCQPVLVLTA